MNAILRLVVLAITAQPLLAQEFDERSIPEPTELSDLALSQGADIRVIGTPVSVESRESVAQIAAIQVQTSNGKRHGGLRVSLESSGETDLVYVEVNEAIQLREEFAGLGGGHNIQNFPCEATTACVMGVARCRPSQSVRQAHCPSVYSTTQGERGALLSTPRLSFRFPEVQATAFVSAIDAAIAELARIETSDGSVR